MDRPELEALIARSVCGLSLGDYDSRQLNLALGTVFGVDSQLIADGTYFTARIDGRLAGCGGWSRRRTLFGADALAGREPDLLDPRCDAARIRAFFTDPGFARRGVGQALYDACEAAARADGFRALELMATLTGVALYRTLGFEAAARVEHDLGQGVTIAFVPMRREI